MYEMVFLVGDGKVEDVATSDGDVFMFGCKVGQEIACGVGV